MGAVELFESVLKHVEENYVVYNFYCERDIVWTLQKEIWKQIRNLNYHSESFTNTPLKSTADQQWI